MELAKIIEQKQERYLTDLMRFIAQPSLSGTGEGIPEMCGMVVESLERLGFTTEVIPTAHHPVIIAERRGRSDRAILFYDHYDVQPVEPLDEWVSDPFAPEIRDGVLYGRGMADNKGDLCSRLAAVDALLTAEGELPCTLRFLIEGEEEIGSPDLRGVIEANRDRLQADACIWEFGETDDDGFPGQYLGFRGMLNLQWEVRTAAQDGHSGVWGGIQPNAVWRLVQALNSVKDSSGKVLIPGFYDGAETAGESDRRCLDALPPMKERYRRQLGTRTLTTGEADGTELYIMGDMEPTFNICGISGGYEGKGAKTIVPCRAFAKTDFRLVKGQHPEDILRKLREHLDNSGFSDIELTVLGMLECSRTASDHPFLALLDDAARRVYGKPQRIHPMTGGSGPAYLFTDVLGIPVFTAGVGNPHSAIHAPNENILLRDYLNAVRYIAEILKLFGPLSS